MFQFLNGACVQIFIDKYNAGNRKYRLWWMNHRLRFVDYDDQEETLRSKALR